MDPNNEDVEIMREQLLLFAKDLRAAGEQVKARQQEADDALAEVRSAYLNIVRTLALVCEMKDSTTRNHLDRTYQYAMQLTKRVAPEYAEEAAIGYGYLLHDIGKVGIPDSVLQKPGPLDDDEWLVMRTHPVIGYQLLQNIDFMGDAVQVVKSHHERWDGRGYPDKIAGEDIYLPARIFTIIDTFDAITSDRPYKPAQSLDYALSEIARVGGTQFDPDLAKAFVQMCEDAGLGQPGATKDSLAFVK